MIVDAGPLIGLDNNDRQTWARFMELVSRYELATTAPVAAQVVRDPARQVNLNRALKHLDADHTAIGFSPGDVRRVGVLCARAGTSDVVDAHLVVAAHTRRWAIWTTDSDDIDRLTAALETGR